MQTWKMLWPVSLAVTLALLCWTPQTARADNVIADDLIVQGNLCVGTPCVDGELFPVPAIKVKATSPRLTFQDTDQTQSWSISSTGGLFGFAILDGGLVTLSIAPGASTSILVDPDGNVGLGTLNPAQKLHVEVNQNANTLSLVRNPFNGVNAAAVVRTQSDVAIQSFLSHASSRTLVRWASPSEAGTSSSPSKATAWRWGPSATLPLSSVPASRRG